jgi:nicotinate-nucleotide adenylyltransferase
VSIRRIGVYGGSFDPPHLAHLALARMARDTLRLDELRVVPAGQPWQKAGRLQASAADREAMVRLLVADEPKVVVDVRELRRVGPSYTVDTLRELAAECPGAVLYLVIGADQFARLDSWHEAEALPRLSHLAVAARTGQQPRPPKAWARRPLPWTRLPLPRIDISATDVRHLAAAGEPVSPLVGNAVAGYIDQHQLYRVPPGCP